MLGTHPPLSCFHALQSRYKFQGAAGQFEDKVAVLTDADNVWTELRHMHMREAIDKLMADFNQFMQDNAGMKGCVRTLCHVSA